MNEKDEEGYNAEFMKASTEYIIAEWIQTEYGNILVDFKPPYKKYNKKIKENKE